jgi:CRP-like cAMP-binding protein
MSDSHSTLFYKSIAGIANLKEESVEKLFSSVVFKQVSQGENILSEGQACKKIFFVESGYLRTFINKDGVEINTGFTFENTFTTSLKSLRLGTPSETAIQAGEKSTIYILDKQKLLALYAVSPEIASFGRNLLEQLLMLQEEHSNLFKIFSPAERYQYLQTHYPHVVQRVSLSHIASYLGVARETLSRIRRRK